jgi:chromosome transmission fidelity protein 8
VQMGGVGEEGGTEGDGKEEELEIVEVVRYKIVFSARPEPISGVSEVE